MAHDPLKLLRVALADAESRLAQARANMEAAADRLGISHDALFADTTFIARTTGQRWADRAKRDGRHEGIEWGWLTALKVERGTSEYSSLRGVKLDLDGPATSAAAAIVRAIVAAGKAAPVKKSEPAQRDPKLTRRKLLT